MKPFSTEKSLIPGLKYIPEYISQAQERDLIKCIDCMLWGTALKRRVQHYGYRYDYKRRSVQQAPYRPLPDWLESLCGKLCWDGILREMADQVIVNE